LIFASALAIRSDAALLTFALTLAIRSDATLLVFASTCAIRSDAALLIYAARICGSWSPSANCFTIRPGFLRIKAVFGNEKKGASNIDVRLQGGMKARALGLPGASQRRYRVVLR